MTHALATLKDRHVCIAAELDKARTRIQQVIPHSTGLAAGRAIAIVLDALSRNPDLLECTPRSVVRSVIHAAEIGLELGSPLGEAFLVPFKGEATMMIGYRGFIRLIRQSPRVQVVKGVLVRASDDFQVDEGANKLHHVLGSGNIKQRGDITHAYSRVYYTDGSSQFEVMDRVELDRIKTDAVSRSTKFSPWKSASHVDEMYKKCPLRRQAKWLELSAVGRRGLELDDLEAMRRGDITGATGARDGSFDMRRAEELKDLLAAQDAKVEVVDADFDT